MHSLSKDYNRRYYINVVKIHILLYWKLLKLKAIHVLLWSAYEIDEDLASQITGRKYR